MSSALEPPQATNRMSVTASARRRRRYGLLNALHHFRQDCFLDNVL